jgi:hypothetical protein
MRTSSCHAKLERTVGRDLPEHEHIRSLDRTAPDFTRRSLISTGTAYLLLLPHKGTAAALDVQEDSDVSEIGNAGCT